MSTERSRFHLAAMIWAALNLGVGCQAVGRDLLVDSGINPHVDASDDTRSATGVATWTVVPIGDDSLVIAGLDDTETQLTAFTLRTGEASFGITVDDGRRLEMTNAGELLENSLTDEDIALLGRFRQDSLVELDAMGLRASGMDCLDKLRDTRLTCSPALEAPSWESILDCASTGAGAIATCHDWYTNVGQNDGQNGDGQTSGQEDGGQGDGGQEDGGQEDDGAGDDGDGDGGDGSTSTGGDDGGASTDDGDDPDPNDSFEDGPIPGYDSYGSDTGDDGSYYGYAPVDHDHLASGTAELPVDGDAQLVFGNGGMLIESIATAAWNLGGKR